MGIASRDAPPALNQSPLTAVSRNFQNVTSHSVTQTTNWSLLSSYYNKNFVLDDLNHMQVISFIINFRKKIREEDFLRKESWCAKNGEWRDSVQWREIDYLSR